LAWAIWATAEPVSAWAGSTDNPVTAAAATSVAMPLRRNFALRTDTGISFKEAQAK
jgi:hypothetical protein